MEQVFQDDPQRPGDRLWRRSALRALGPAFVTVFIALVGAGVTVVLGMAVSNESFGGPAEKAWGLLLVFAFAIVMSALSWLCFREARGRRAQSIRLTATGLTLDLPAGRSLIHDPPRCCESIAWRDVTAIETRQEAYRSQGLTNLQRVYRLTRTSGAPILLFEERALDTGMATAPMDALANEIAARARLTVTDRGMVQGKGGLLGAWLTAPPSWSAEPLSGARRVALRNGVAFTATMASVMMLLVWLVPMLVALAG